MPVTSFALLIFCVTLGAGLTIWAMSVWGLTTVMPLLLGVSLLARWALGHVPNDDPHP